MSVWAISFVRMVGKDLQNKALNGIKWSLVDNVANSGITFLVGLVLARLLSPIEFGIIGIVTIFINLSNTIVDGGFITALVRKPHVDDKDLNTVYYSNLFVSILLSVFLSFASKWLSEFFELPILLKIIPIMSSLLIINALSLIHKTLLVIRIDFKTQALVSFIASVLSGIVGISLAYYGYGVWSLVVQQILRQTLLMLLFGISSKWSPSLLFSINRFKDLFNFGSKILLANLINSIYKDIFLVVIGKMYTATDLGQYNRAEQFNSIFTNNLTLVIQKVMLPVLSKMQDNKLLLQNAFKKVLNYSGFVTFILVFALSAVAKPFVILLVGEQWLPAVEYLQIMCCYGAIYPLQIININLLNVLKCSDKVLKLEVIKKILFLGVIASGFIFELKYMLWFAVIYYYIEFILNSWYSEKLIGFGTFKQIKSLFPYWFVSIVISLIVWSISLLDISYAVMLFVQCLVLVALYLIYYELKKDSVYLELKMLFLNQLKEVFNGTKN